MKTSDLAKNIENLPKKHKMAILHIVDQKVSNDMKEVLYEIKSMKETFNSRMSSLEDKLDSTKNAMNIKYNVLLGMISFLMIIISIFEFLKGLK